MSTWGSINNNNNMQCDIIERVTGQAHIENQRRVWYTSFNNRFEQEQEGQEQAQKQQQDPLQPPTAAVNPWGPQLLRREQELVQEKGKNNYDYFRVPSCEVASHSRRRIEQTGEFLQKETYNLDQARLITIPLHKLEQLESIQEEFKIFVCSKISRGLLEFGEFTPALTLYHQAVES